MDAGRLVSLALNLSNVRAGARCMLPTMLPVVPVYVTDYVTVLVCYRASMYRAPTVLVCKSLSLGGISVV